MRDIPRSELRSLVEALYVAIDSEDKDTLARLLRADAVFERPATRPLVGRDAIIEFYARDRNVASGRHTVDHIVIGDHGDGAAWGAFVGRTVEGSTLELWFADAFTFEDGVIQTRRSHVYAPPPA